MAGKIRPACWRGELLNGRLDRQAAEFYKRLYPQPAYGREPAPGSEFPVWKWAVAGGHHYTGPYPLAQPKDRVATDGELDAHGEDTHGVGLDWTGGHGGLSRTTEGEKSGVYPICHRQLVGMCFRAIDRSDIVFAHFDAPAAEGTLVEIGYAVGRGVPVFVSRSGDDPAPWFATAVTDTAHVWGRSLAETFAEAVSRYWEMAATGRVRRPAAAGLAGGV